MLLLRLFLWYSNNEFHKIEGNNMADKKYYGADAIVDSLVNHDVKYVFGIPGAKIDRVFERLEHPVNPKSPRLIVTRHEPVSYTHLRAHETQ